MTVVFPADDFAAPRRVEQWRVQLIWLGCAVALVLLAFARDVATLAHLLWTSTTFGHCLFIGPVVAWLVWQRRAELVQVEPVGWAPGLAAVLAAGVVWLVGAAAGVALFRQLGLLGMVEGAVLTLLGPAVARTLVFPLAYAVLLVPFGEAMERPLQTVTVAMTLPMLHAVGLSAISDGVLLTVGDQHFEVAEACSGAKFEIAMVAYGVLVANVCFVSWRRRAVFLTVALSVPIFANAVRVFATIVAAHFTSMERATGFDHIVYGWIFFAVVMAGVLTLGWRWFDRDPNAPIVDVASLPPVTRHRLAAPAATVALLATVALFPAWAAAIDARTSPLPSRVALPEVPGWRLSAPDPRAPWSPNYPGADRLLLGRYIAEDGAAVDLAVALEANQRDGHELVGFGIGPLREDDRWVRVSGEPPLAGGDVIRIITAPGPTERLVASWYRIGATLTASPARVKLATLEAKLLGGDQAGVALHVSAVVAPGRDARADMTRFLAALGPLDRLADRLTGAR
jgi:exosortase A